jgi:hypothetical protein
MHFPVVVAKTYPLPSWGNIQGILLLVCVSFSSETMAEQTATGGPDIDRYVSNLSGAVRARL